MRPPPRLTNVGREGANGVGRARQVDIDRDMPVRVLHLEERMEALDARIGEQNINAAEFPFAFRGRRSQRLEVALIERDAEPAAAGCKDKPASFL